MKKIKNAFRNVNKTAFFICLGVSISLIVAAFIIPPPAKIDPSVLQAVGELFGFATLSTVLVGIERGTDVRVSKGDTSVSINSPDEPKELQ